VFLDPDNGWLVNARGEVHATHDGGATWTHLANLPSGIFPRSVGFASSSKGWIGNLNVTAGDLVPNSALWETSDGGQTWTNISGRITGPNVVGLCGMRVLNPNFIVAVGRWNGPPLFVKSTDGGKSWTSRSMTAFVNGLVDVSFVNEHSGFAVGALADGTSQSAEDAAQAVILATSDGGETWQVRYTSGVTGNRCWKIQFASDQVGYVTTEGSHAQGVVLKTTDGGVSWTPMLVSQGQPLEAVAFVDPEHGWVASPDTIYSTTDGGATWKTLFFGTLLNRMRVVNDSLVFGCGDRVYRWKRG
jgi:photosystem II stability/assembly factor-like uncharacterized protein